MSQQTNQPRRPGSKIPSRSQTPVIRATDSSLTCALQPHLLDIDDIRDSYQSNKDQIFYHCDKQPCPNRYDVPFTRDLPSFAKRIEREAGQEELIRGHIDRTQKASVASTSQQPQEPQQPPAPPPSPPAPEPSLPISQPSIPHTPKPEPAEPNQPEPDPDDPEDPDLDLDSDDDDEDDIMSKVLKAFDKVTVLRNDGSNWDTWQTRVELATQSVGLTKFLTYDPNDPDKDAKEEEGTDEDKLNDSNLLNAIIGRLSDGIFRRYKAHPSTKKLWANLEEDYDSKNAITESHLQQQLHSMRCTDPAKVNGHLDTMIQIKDNLEKRNIHINDDVFINTIIASIPKVFSPTINALIIVSSKTKTKLTPQELIASI